MYGSRAPNLPGVPGASTADKKPFFGGKNKIHTPSLVTTWPLSNPRECTNKINSRDWIRQKAVNLCGTATLFLSSYDKINTLRLPSGEYQTNRPIRYLRSEREHLVLTLILGRKNKKK